jgi:Tol biopolymer transport system component
VKLRSSVLVLSLTFAATIINVEPSVAAPRCGGGVYVAVERTVRGNADLWGLNAKGERVRMTTDAARDADPSWAPDGRSVAFIRGSGAHRELWMLDTKTCTEEQLTPDGVVVSDPDWGPGGLIAFTYHYDGGTSIAVLVLETGELGAWTSWPGQMRNASWSPFGDQLVLEADTDGDWDLYVASPSSATQITNEPGIERAPSWSPDGDSIAFTADQDGNQEVYAVRLDGSDLVRLTTTDAAEVEPTWAPYAQGIVVSRGSASTVVGFDRDGSNSEPWGIKGSSIDVRPPSPLRQWQDSVAKHSLRRAAVEARSYYVDHGSYDGITFLTMFDALPDLTWVAGSVDSNGPRLVSVSEQDSTFTAVACSDSGACFAIRETDNAETSYSVTLESGWSAQDAESAGVDRLTWPYN